MNLETIKKKLLSEHKNLPVFIVDGEVRISLEHSTDDYGIGEKTIVDGINLGYGQIADYYGMSYPEYNVYVEPMWINPDFTKTLEKLKLWAEWQNAGCLCIYEV